jgi:hypothetical protein
LIDAPAAQLVRTTWVSPSSMGSAVGAGRAEQGSMTVVPGGLGGSPGHIRWVTLSVSPALNAGGRSM